MTGVSAAKGAVAALALTLTACQPAREARLAPPDMPIAVRLEESTPEPVRAALAGEIAAAAAERRLQIVEPGGPARYRATGYLSIEDGEGTPALAFVFDVADEGRRRARRVAGKVPIRSGAAADPWAGLDKAALARLAAESMDEIAGFLAASAAQGEAAAPAGG